MWSVACNKKESKDPGNASSLARKPDEKDPTSSVLAPTGELESQQRHVCCF
jgi:hypothetical protein